MSNQTPGPNSAAVADESQTDTAPPAVKIGFLQRFTILRTAARELWLTFAIKFTMVVAYSVMNSTMILWLSSDLGFGDLKAGAWMGVWSSALTLVTVMVGSLTDSVGIRRTLLMGAGVCIAARLMLTFSVNPLIAITFGLMPLAVGEALLGPVMVAATKRYATTAQRSISFSIIYAVMNAGFFVASYIFDYVRQGFEYNGRHFGGEYGSYPIPFIGELSTYRTLFLISFLLTVPTYLIVRFFMREGVEVTDQGMTITPAVSKYPGAGMFQTLWLTIKDTALDTVRIFAGLWKQPGFYRFLLFLLFASFMRLIFYHTSYTFPKFGIRELGEGAPIGRLSAINFVLIIFLVPVVGALTMRISAYKMVVFGSCIAAASVFFMAVPPEIFKPLADGWLGHLIAHKWFKIPGEVNPWFISIVLFYVTVSLGEAFYSPRLYEYAAVIAPRGQEASYMALSYLPMFLAKLVAAPLSGWLLMTYCPEVGERRSHTMWLIIALMTAIAPVGLIVFRRYIRVQEAGRE